jgi:L-ectoine synthase
MRLLHAEDGMGVTLADAILEAGFEMELASKNYLEACYCLEGEGILEELESGKIHEIRPGTLYAMDRQERHRVTAKTKMRLIASITPPLTGGEIPGEIGSL